MKMNKAKRAEEYTSKLLDNLLNEVNPKDQQRTENKMLLAAKIDDARLAKGWNQTKFAQEMGKQPSEISKWLSGTHNFTSDTLWDIEEKLGFRLISLQEEKTVIIKVAEYKTMVAAPAIGFGDRYVRLMDALPSRDYPKHLLSKQNVTAYA